MLQGMYAMEKESPEGAVPEFLRTHPSTPGRVKAAQKLAEEAGERIRNSGRCDPFLSMFQQGFQLGGTHGSVAISHVGEHVLGDAEWHGH
jgi:predicted Zn-dependent protease